MLLAKIISLKYFIPQVRPPRLANQNLNCVCLQARWFKRLAMEAAATAIEPQPCLVKASFDQKVAIRAERHEQLRGRKNVTSCRSPTRENETLRIKTELKEKRHLDFLRRRSVSPEPPGVSRCRNCSSRFKFSPLRPRSSKAGFPDSHTSNGHLVTMSSQSYASDGQRRDCWVKFHLLTLETDSCGAPAAQSPLIAAPVSSSLTSAGFMVVRKHNCEESQEIYLHTENCSG